MSFTEASPKKLKVDSTVTSFENKSCTREDLLFMLASFRERLGFFLENAKGSDVKFIVGVGDIVETIPAHKVILASSSPVFYSMFFGDMESQDEIVVPDCDPEAFKLFIQFLYTDNPPEASSMGSKVSDLIYIARKYFFLPLEQHCSTYIQANINPDIVFDILETADLYSLPQLTATCWGYIEDNTSPVLEAQLKTLSLDKLCTILGNDYLNIREMDLFSFVVRWAQYKCEESGIEPTPENFRIVAEKAFNLIRYPTISPHDIADHVAPSNILSSSQIASIYNYIYATNESGRPTIEFNAKPRAWENKGKVRVQQQAEGSGSETDGFNVSRTRRLSRATRRTRARRAAGAGVFVNAELVVGSIIGPNRPEEE